MASNCKCTGGKPVDYSKLYPSINPGELKHVVTVLQQTVGPMGTSGEKIGWQQGSPPSMIHCKIEPMRGTDVIKSGQDISQTFVTITMRWTKNIFPSVRLLGSNGAIYIVCSIQNLLMMNVVLVCTCILLGTNE